MVRWMTTTLHDEQLWQEQGEWPGNLGTPSNRLAICETFSHERLCYRSEVSVKGLGQ